MSNYPAQTLVMESVLGMFKLRCSPTNKIVCSQILVFSMHHRGGITASIAMSSLATALTIRLIYCQCA